MTYREVKQVMADGQVVSMKADMTKRAVRLHHPEWRNSMFTFEVPIRYPNPELCGPCRKVHHFKTHHLHLDAQGDVTVSEAVYQQLRDVGLVGELQATKEVVPRPTALGMGFLDYKAQVIPNFGTPDEPKEIPVPIPILRPQHVVSREHGEIGENHG
jgi:ribosomal protein S19E (S16A)